jgi:hypothetical protein
MDFFSILLTSKKTRHRVMFCLFDAAEEFELVVAAGFDQTVVGR